MFWEVGAAGEAEAAVQARQTVSRFLHSNAFAVYLFASVRF